MRQQIAQEMGLAAPMVEDIRAAALLHDIGKLEVSRKVLYKSAKLTNDDERQEMYQHVNRGGELVDMAKRLSCGVCCRSFWRTMTASAIPGLQSPTGLKIPLGARIISVADVYDALTSDRPYRKALPLYEARDYIVKKAGTEFDPAVVDAFTLSFNRGLLEVPELMV